MVPYIFHYFQFNHTVTCLSVSAMLAKGYPVQMLILTGLLFGALLNALLYLLVLINPKKMNQLLVICSVVLHQLNIRML